MFKTSIRLTCLFFAFKLCFALVAHETDDYKALTKEVALIKTPINSMGMKLTLIPEGSLEGNHNAINTPFYLSQIITREQWEKVMGKWRLSKKGNSDLPAVNISQKTAEKFCKTLSLIDGRHYRLPTEAELEYAHIFDETVILQHPVLHGTTKKVLDNFRIICPINKLQNRDTAREEYVHLFYSQAPKILYKPKRPAPRPIVNYFNAVTVLDVTIGKTGLTESINVIEGPRDHVLTSLEYVNHWRFEPAKVEGHAVPSRFIVEIVRGDSPNLRRNQSHYLPDYREVNLGGGLIQIVGSY